MKTILLFLLFSGGIYAQQCGKLVINPITKKLDCSGIGATGPTGSAGVGFNGAGTFAQMNAATPSTNDVWKLSDATAAGYCGAGGGTAKALCVWTGAAWVPSGGMISGGTSGQVPFQSAAGVTAFSNGIAYNDTTKFLGLVGGMTAGQVGVATGQIVFNGTTSGSVTIKPNDAAGTAIVMLLPNGNSNPVRGIADPSDTSVVNYIGTDGVQHRIAQSGGGNGNVTGGSAGQVPFQSGPNTTVFSNGIAYNDSTKTLGLIGGITVGQASTGTGQVAFNGSTSGTVTIKPNAVAGTATVLLPSGDSNPVRGIADPSDTSVVNYVGVDGVQHRIAQTGAGVPYTGATTNVDLGTHKIKASEVEVGDGTASPGIVLPELVANGAHDTRIYGAAAQASSGCIIWPVGVSTSGQVAMDSNTTSTTTDGKVCRVFTWQTPAGGTGGGAIAVGMVTLGTAPIASGACSSAATAAATGATVNNILTYSFNGDPTAITGSKLKIIPYTSADTVAFKVCNDTVSSVTPSAVTLNWAVNAGAASGGGGTCSLTDPQIYAWWEADAVTCTGGCTTGNPVTAWTDHVGTNHLITADAGTYAATKINGLPAVLFNGSSNVYSLTNVDAIPDPASGQGIRLYAVLQIASTASGQAIMSGRGTGDLNWTINKGTLQAAESAFVVGLGSGNAAADLLAHQIGLYWINGTSVAFRLDGASDGGATTATNVSGHVQQFGRNVNTEYLNAWVSAIIVGSAATNTTNVEAYLKCKYGVGI